MCVMMSCWARDSIRLVLFLGAVMCGWTAAGCGPKATVMLPPEGREVESLDQAMKRIGADPMAFLKGTLDETRKLAKYTTHFQRQERLGLFSELKPVENIFTEYRDKPFSVRFTWLDDGTDYEYQQCVYVEGKHHDKVRLLPRIGLFGLPPSVQEFAPKLAVIFGKTRNPITDFGPRRLMERTIDRIEKAKPHGEVGIKLYPPTEIGPAKEPCFHIELRYPLGEQYACKLQDLYIHTQTHLPVATYLWLPGNPERTEDTLDAMYVYGEVNADVPLTAAHFVIDVDKRKPEKSASAGPTGKDGPKPVYDQTSRSNQEGDQ